MLRLAPLADGQARRPAMLAAFGAGVLAAAGQAPLFLWPVALTGFVLLFLMVLPAAAPWRAARILWLGGAGYFAAALIWIVQPFLVDAARHGWMAPFALGLISFGLALFWGGAGFAAARLGHTRGQRALALVVTLSLAELARGYVLTGFPWAQVGHLWIGTPVMQLAAWGGAPLLTLLALAVALLPAGGGARGAVLALVLTGVGWGAGAWRMAQSLPVREAAAPVVRLVQPNAAQHLKWREDMIPVFLRRQLELTAEASDPAPDLIVWSETAIPYLLGRAGPVLEQISLAAGGRPVVLGLNRREGERFLNAAAVLGPGGTPQQVYDKHHLVPFGEYLPFADFFARFNVFGLAVRGGYAAGPGPALLDLGAAGRALPLICYEAIFPQDVRAAPERPDWLLQITNDAWFGTFSGPYQHLAQARLRAVEQGLPLLRSANTGVSAVIGPKGAVLASLSLNTAGQLTAPLPPALPATLYTRLGDGPLTALLVVALAALGLRRVAARR